MAGLRQSASGGGGPGNTGTGCVRPLDFTGFIFNPADLAENVDLDMDLRKEILFIEAHLSKWHHYDLLRVRPSMTIEGIRRCFLDLSRRFHPDRYYGKKLGSYGPRLTRIFQAMTRAHEVLSNPSKKAEYDRVTEVALTPEELAEEERKRQDGEREQADARKRKQRLIKTNPFLRSRAKQADFVKEAEAAAAREDWKQAANLYRLALGYAPDDAILKAKLDEVDRKAKAQRADDLIQRAESALVLGRQDESKRLYDEAASAAPRDLEVLLRRVVFLLSSGADAEELVLATKQATVVGRASSKAWTYHGHSLLKYGDKKGAREAYTRASKIDPRNSEALDGVKKLRWVIF